MTASVKQITALFGKSRSGKQVETVVATTLREAIKNRKLVPGTALPSTQALAKELKANLNAVNRALSLLAAEGFLERRRHVGTVVVSPEQRQRLVVCLIGPDLKSESSFMSRRLYQLLEEELARRNYKVRCIDKLHATASPDPKVATEAMDALIKELIHFPPTAFIFDRFVLERYAELRDYFSIPGIHRSGRPGEIGTVSGMKEQILTEGIPYLRQNGCKRVVLVSLSSITNPDGRFFELFWQQLEANKMECEQIVELYDHLLAEGTTEECQNRLTELLEIRATRPMAERFDALLVRDDTVMRGAASALLKAGIDVPSEIRVLVNTNRGINHHYGLHVDRLELPLDALAEELVNVLEEKLMAPSKPLQRRTIKSVLKPSVLPSEQRR